MCNTNKAYSGNEGEAATAECSNEIGANKLINYVERLKEGEKT